MESQNAVQQILKKNLESLLTQHMQVLEAMESQVTEVEQKVNSLDSNDHQSIEGALRLAAHMDVLKSKLATCHQTLGPVSGGAENELSAPSELAMASPMANEREINESAARCNTENENRAVALSVLQTFQQQAAREQNIQYKEVLSRLQKVEKRLSRMGQTVESQCETARKLTHLEARVQLIQDMQVRNNQSVETARNLSKLQKEIQEDITCLGGQQRVLEEELAEVKNMSEDLIRLRNTLSQLHINVTSREDLAKKLFQLEEEMTKVQCQILSPQQDMSSLLALSTSIASSQENELMPAFAAKVLTLCKVKPREKIVFHEEVLNHWGCFDSTSSIFAAPTDGIYFFSASININSRNMFGANIILNGRGVASFGCPAVTDLQTSTSVILNLSADDKVWVEANNVTDQNGVKIGSGYSNFIGCRLR